MTALLSLFIAALPAVQEPEPASLVVQPSELTLRVGESAKLEATVKDSEGNVLDRRVLFLPLYGQYLESRRAQLKLAGLSLFRGQGFTAVAVLTIALGVGASTAIFTIVRSVLLEALPHEEPEQLVRFWTTWDAYPRGAISEPEYFIISTKIRSSAISPSIGAGARTSPSGTAIQRES